MDPITIAALIGGGADIFGGLLGSSSAKAQNKAAAQQSQKEMDFQERMSSTAHQREVADLRAAGLNPILSAHGGASSPGGAMAPVVNPAEPLRDSLKSSASRIMESQRMKAEINLANQSAKTQATQQGLNNANARLADVNASVASGGKIGFMGTSVPISAFSAKSITNVPSADSIKRAWLERKYGKKVAAGMSTYTKLGR